MGRSDNAGTETWKQYMDVLRAGGAVDSGHKPRGASAVSPYPLNGEVSQLPIIWREDAEHASHVVYHYGTPVAWIDGRDNGWVVPPASYSPTTAGVQNRIRARLEGIGFRTTVGGDGVGSERVQKIANLISLHVGGDADSAGNAHAAALEIVHGI